MRVPAVAPSPPCQCPREFRVPELGLFDPHLAVAPRNSSKFASVGGGRREKHHSVPGQDLTPLRSDPTDQQLTEGDVEAVLEGQTFSGTVIRGSDSVRIVPDPANASAIDAALVSWAEPDSSEDDDSDALATQAADELALMLVE